MRLSYYCAKTSCGKINYINVKSENRYDLKQEIGEEFNERCEHCRSQTKKHINRLHGEMDMRMVMLSVLFALMLTVITWYLGYIIGAITFGIPGVAWYAERKKASEFNKIMID